MNAPGSEPKRRSASRSCLLFGCLPLLLLILIPGGMLWYQARQSLRERTRELDFEIASFEAELSQPRPVMFGDPQPGNAADEYWLINYVLGAPDTWDAKIPVTLAPTQYSYKHAETNKVETTMASIELIKRAKANDRGPLPADAARYLKLYAPLADHIRAGMRKERCDWRPPIEKGAASDILNLIEARSLANMMAYQAVMADGEEAVEKALEVIVFGRELARHPSLIHSMIGIAVQNSGAETLGSILGRELSPAAYRQVAEVLGRLEPIDIERGLIADRLFLSVHLAAMSGEEKYRSKLDNEEAINLYANSSTARAFGKLLNNRLVLEREWEAYRRWHKRALELARMPFTQRVRASATFDKELEEAWVGVARLAIPNVHEACLHAEKVEASLQALRMLAAAHLHRLEAGSFPEDGAALKPFLGGALPADPFQDREKPLAYELGEGEARVSWSQGSLSTAAPKAGGK